MAKPGDDDRRVRRTRRTLREALLSLVMEKGWDSVSVLDVCAKADIGRSTFYVHFADKEDLLLSGFDDLLVSLSEHRSQNQVPFAFAEPLLAHAAENLGLFRAIAGGDSRHQVLWRLRDVVKTLVEADLEAMSLPANARPATARFVAGGFADMMTGWLEDARRVAPQTLAAGFRSMALAAIRAATQTTA